MSATHTPARVGEHPATHALEAQPWLRHGLRSAEPAVEQLAPGRYLVVESGHIPLERGVTHIGRGMSADVRLDDHTVSARHAIVVARPTSVRILDDRSTNGTLVNGRRVEESELKDGDVVVLGRVVMTYREL